MSKDLPPQNTEPVRLPRRYPPAPLIGVAAAVFDTEGRILLVQRGKPPRAGQWGLPGGLLDLGERLTDGVRREVWEECAIEIEVCDLVDAFEPILHDEQGRIEYHYVVLDYWARYVAGKAVAQDDAQAVAWVDPSDMDDFRVSADTAGVITRAHTAWQAAQ
jgi:ADP-ribose pyrophosphatase YjhB (NUDIX family)